LLHEETKEVNAGKSASIHQTEKAVETKAETMCIRERTVLNKVEANSFAYAKMNAVDSSCWDLQPQERREKQQTDALLFNLQHPCPAAALQAWHAWL
jgi:hypothetical protein